MHSVFVSKPSALTEHQQYFWERFRARLEERNIDPRTVGATDYPSNAPVGKVKEVMNQCHGAIILGLKQIRIIDGVTKEGTDKQGPLRNYHLPTAWNHIESGMAFALGLPILIVKESGINGGLFERGASEKYVHEIELPADDWFDSMGFLQPLNSFIGDVNIHEANAR